jgi:uncharacterized protein involved in type VI secretion and phage assembly
MFDEISDVGRLAGTTLLSGITTGIVTDNYDSEHPGMVRVELALGPEGYNRTEWIRVASSYAGNGYGYYSLPEVGDEVAVAFNMGDPNRPYVIGAFWSDKNKLPEKTANEKNTVKRLKTKGGHEIIFEDDSEKSSVKIHTAKSLAIELDDKKETIIITDADGNNLMTVDSKKGAIEIKAKNSISFAAGGAATLKLDGQGRKAELKADSITLDAKMGLKLKGVQLKAEGNQVEIKGAMCKVQSDGVLELKGSMTKIN